MRRILAFTIVAVLSMASSAQADDNGIKKVVSGIATINQPGAANCDSSGNGFSQASKIKRLNSDPELQRAVHETCTDLSWMQETCSKSAATAAGQTPHDAVLPGAYTEPVTCKGIPDTARERMAQLKDFFESSIPDFSTFKSKVGYLQSSPQTLAGMKAVSDADLGATFKQMVLTQGLSECGGKDPEYGQDCPNTDFDGGVASANLSFTPASSANITKGQQKSTILVLKMSDILKSASSCEIKKQEISELFQRKWSTDDWDDYVVLKWLSAHRNEAVRNRETRNLLAGATQLNRPIDGPAYAWTEAGLFEQAGDNFFEESAVSTKMLILGINQRKLADAGVKGYDGLASLSPSARDKLASAVLDDLKSALKSSDVRDKIVSKARADCDARIAQILGGPGALASATGLDYNDQGNKVEERFHTFKTMHMYPGEEAKAHGPLYAPKGYTSAGAGSTSGIGSYILAYPKLGRYRNVTLNFNHLADANYLLHGSDETNADGSVRVGSTGGDGGAGDGPYDHSHINLIASDGHTKLNFVDAFCK